jgi:hypothetical protein
MDCANTWLHSNQAAGGTVGSERPLEGGNCLEPGWKTKESSTPMWIEFDVPASQ